MPNRESEAHVDVGGSTSLDSDKGKHESENEGEEGQSVNRKGSVKTGRAQGSGETHPGWTSNSVLARTSVVAVEMQIPTTQ